MAKVASLVRGFPGVPTVAVLSHHDGESSERLLELGACGVRRAVDVSRRDGWRELRVLVEDPASPTGSRILARVIPALGDPSPDCQYFFETVVRLAPGVSAARQLARRLRVTTSTLMSRFFRAGLPSPKRYLVAVRLVYAAGLLETPGFSIADVAYRLEYSSPQSFGRHLRTELGVTAAEFRNRFSFETSLDDFVARLIIPYRQSFRQFRPLEDGVADLGHLWWRRHW
jgi:AraC-like DNA-binding protein